MTKMRILLALALLLAAGAALVLVRAKVTGPRYDAQLRFRLVSSGAVKLPAAQGNAAQELRIETVVDDSAQVIREGNRIELHWDDPKFEMSVNGRRLPEQEAMLKAAGKQLMVLELGREGNPEKFFYRPLRGLRPEASELLVNTAKMILFQLAWDPAQKGKATGTDFWGRTELSWKDPFEVTTESAAKTESGLRGTGRFTVTFDGNGYLATVKGYQETAPEGALALGTSRSTYDLSLSHHTVIELATDLSGLETSLPWVIVNPDSVLRAAYADRTAGWSLERVAKEAEALRRARSTSMTAISPLSEKLYQLLWLDHSRAPAYAKLALELGPKHPLFDELLKALSQVGDAGSQAALLDVLRALRGDPASLKVMINVAFTRAPGPEAERMLEDIAANPASPGQKNSAELLLGQMAWQLRETEPQRAWAIEARFREILVTARDPREVAHALDVIGNTGLCGAPTVLAAYASDVKAPFFPNALESLRYCRNELAAITLLQAFGRGGRSTEAALKALEMRAERGIYDEAVFTALLEWLKANGRKREKSRTVMNVLGLLGSLDASAGARLEQARKSL